MKFFKNIIGILGILALFSLPFKVAAQGPTDPCTDPADPCPIDSNLVVLVVAAVIIAAKKTYSFKNFSAKF